jgi:hypothetical protein
MRLLFALSIVIFLSVKLEAHPIHVSIVNVDIHNDSSALTYSVRLFYADFQSLLNARYNTFIDFEHQQRMSTKDQQSMLIYMNESLNFRYSKEEKLIPEFKGWQKEDDTVWLFFSIAFQPNTDVLYIENRLMLDLFNDQKNLMILNINGADTALEFNQRIMQKEIRI